MATIYEVLSRFDVTRRTPKGGFAKCPAHDDTRASLSICLGESGNILMTCFAGCSTETVLQKVGLQMLDLAGPDVKIHGNGQAKALNTYYDYRDASGQVVFQVVRKTPKGFYQRRNQNGQWINNMDGVTRTIYRLPEWRAASAEEWRFIVEGEKDVDKAYEHGIVATCNAGGAGKWKPDYSNELRGCKVCLLPDNDAPGRSHANEVGRLTHGLASDLRVLALPGLKDKGDLYDWLSAGGTKEKLIALAEAAPKWSPGMPELNPNGEGESSVPEKPADPKASSEKPESIPLPPLRTFSEMMGMFPALRPEVIHGIAREGETINLVAAPKIGKSFTAIDMALATVTGRPWLGRFPTTAGQVVIIDNELHEETATARIRWVGERLGIPETEWAHLLRICNLRGHLIDIHRMKGIFDQIDPGEVKLVIIDALYRALPEGCDENKNADMAAIYNLVDVYAARMRAVFALVHHSSKGNQAGKATTDVGSGAGSMGRATDAHLAFREHEMENGIVVSTALRSFPRIAPFCLRWNFPVFTLADDLNPNDIKREKSRGGRPRSDRPAKAEKAKQTVWTAERLANEIVGSGPLLEAEILAKGREAGLSMRAAKDWLSIAESKGLVYRLPRTPRELLKYSTTKPSELPNLTDI